MEKKDEKSKKEQFIDSAINDPDLKGFSKNKKLQLFALKVSYGNVTKAAKILGLDRQAFYKNCWEDDKYKAMFDEIKVMCIEIVEDKLMENIMSGDQTAIMYYLNCQGNARGWVNSRKLDHTTNGKDMPAAEHVFFVSADQLTPEQLQDYIKKYIERDTNDESS